MKPPPKPKLFIGSSREAIKYCQSIHANLQRVAQVLPWYAGSFPANEFTMEALERRLDQCDFGVFVFSPDDVALIRGKHVFITRDNTLFEAGLFYGKLRRKRVFFIIPDAIEISDGDLFKGVKIDQYHLLSDLSGMTLLTYEYGHDDEYEAATSVACSKIASAIEAEQFYEDPAKTLIQRNSTSRLLWEYGRLIPLTKDSTLKERYHALSEAVRLSFVVLPNTMVTHVALYAKQGMDGMAYVAGNIDAGAFYPFQAYHQDEEEPPIVLKVQQSGTEWSFAQVKKVEKVSVLCYPLAEDHVISIHIRGDQILTKDVLQVVVKMNEELLSTIALLVGGDSL
ncbi:TIR domain-containing protein [Paenibacillus sp. FSL R5-0527]|uniref:TIR domain-containing protein n=1 Tax=Paenibacillus sp. FSL R5-0527 TaxID=2975321 RepID=UPI00097A8929|nr:hypothetical protein BK140_31725 [Paenibacillus macerans]